MIGELGCAVPKSRTFGDRIVAERRNSFVIVGWDGLVGLVWGHERGTVLK